MSDMVGADESQLDELLASFLRQLDSGQRLDPQEFLREHPQYARELEELIETSALVERLASAEAVQAVQSAEAVASGLDETASIVIGRCDPSATPTVGLNVEPSASRQDRSAGSSAVGIGTALGDYELLEVIGRGGMGVVYKARQKGLNRLVAVKLIRDARLASPVDIQRFQTEAQAAARLEHPHIVTVHQVGEIDGQHFFSMDFVEGTDLAALARNGPLEPQRAARYLRTIAETIHFAHENGIIHRDLKPANVLIDTADRPLLTDFGLAKTVGHDTGITTSGTALGTPSFMSPEQAAGKHSEVGRASDIYSLGTILYVMLTGQAPFIGENVLETILDVIHKEPPPPASINPRANRTLEIICLKCLDKDPAKRYATALDLAHDLNRFLHGEPTQAVPIGRTRRMVNWVLDIPLVAALVGKRIARPTVWHRRAQWLCIASLAAMFLAMALWQLPGGDSPSGEAVRVASGVGVFKYHRVAMQLKPYLEERLGRKVEVVQTKGSRENVERLVSGEVALALVQASDVTPGIALISPLYDEVVLIFVRRDCGISEFSQLCEHIRGVLGEGRVSVGEDRMGMQDIAFRLLSYYGVPAESPRIERTSFEAMQRDSSLVAAIVTTGLDNGPLGDLLSTGEYRILALPDVSGLSRSDSSLHPFVVRQGDISSQTAIPPEGISTVATTAFLAVKEDEPDEELVRGTLQALHSDSDLAATRHLFSLEEVVRWRQDEFHPAAIRFFSEQSAARADSHN